VSNASSVDVILSQGGEREKAYDWLGAVEFYEKASGLVPETGFFKLGQVQERVGYAFYRAGMQAESVDEFGERIRLAVTSYEKAKEYYGKMSESSKTPRMLRCDAMVAFLAYWLSVEVPEKKRLIGECWRLTKDALRGLKEAGDALEYGKTCNQLLVSAFFSLVFEGEFQVRENAVKEAMEYGEQAVKFLSASGDSDELARAYVNAASYLELFGYYFQDLDGRDKFFQKARDYWQKGNELSEEVAFLELLSLEGVLSLDWGIGTDKALKNFEKALEYAKRTRDKLRIGCALEWLGFHTFWGYSEDPDESVRLFAKGLHYAEDAKLQYSIISFVSPLGDVLWVEAPYAEYYWASAMWETNLSKKRELLEKAVEATSDLMSRAEKSGYPQDISYAHHVVGKVLTSQAVMESNSEEKKRLLEKAVEHRNETIKYAEQTTPFDYWNRGVMQVYLADIKSELSNIASDNEDKKSMLEAAAIGTENGLKLLLRDLAFWEKKGIISTQYSNVRIWQYRYGNLLKRLYDVAHNKECLRKAIEAFEDSAESAQKLNIISGLAECSWEIAQTYDALGEHLKAAENFNIASNNYKGAAEKMPQLKDFYQDLSLYMQAWSEIEKARHHHAKQEYGAAEERFGKAADLHKSLKQRNYLAPNYAAWAQVERAEEMSRKEQSEEAIQAFEQAAKLFNETKKSLQTKLNEIEDPDEKQMVKNVLKATHLRLQYCTARTALEEAKILDRRGDHYSSSQKYGSAVETFEKISQVLESEQEQKEFRFIISLSRAWQRMMLAESRASPELYMEASQLFEQSSEHSGSEKASILMLGHSRFCKALAAGTKFADTRDITMHAAAINHLESAANYYVKAGFQNASEYAKATGLLFDAYMHMDNAKRETDPDRKARLYVMAEKVLQTSAGSFMKAEHPEKREQVLRLLEKAREERELASSLSEVLHAPSIVSATTVFASPTPNQENAVGVERFEEADIQANIITRQKELKIGENLDLEIELINAGKGPALLTKIIDVIPEGFELKEKPENYRMEDSFLNLKGKRLDPLKMEEVKLVLQPKTQGTFPLKPRIMYLDEKGRYKTHEPEPVTITVKELGIKGWLKGEK
jgi:tetratricopeptide (TPR) repeat protein